MMLKHTTIKWKATDDKHSDIWRNREKHGSIECLSLQPHVSNFILFYTIILSDLIQNTRGEHSRIGPWVAGTKHPRGRAFGSKIAEFVFDVAHFAPCSLWTLFIRHKSSSSPGGWSPSYLLVSHLFPLQRPKLVLSGETLTLNRSLAHFMLLITDRYLIQLTTV